jgi:Fe-S cluster assembly iron-binding protein IscA
VLPRERDGLFAVARLGDDLVPGTLEQVAQVESDDGLVFCDQDAHAWAYNRTMLQIAEDAVDAFRQMGTLRIRGVEGDGEVELEIEEATEPVADDQVVEREGVQIFLDPVAASALDDQVIGVHAHDDHFHFTFDDQPE